MSVSTPPADKNGDNAAQLSDMLRERYLSYALSTIVSRALPDVRDGLKPVHRRILYAMQQGGFRSDRAYNKSARIVGDVMGKYHPHGDQAIYDAMVRMAQDFSMRLPMVDGQGNFGSIDPDRAAAARYTEARMTPAAEAMLRGIDEDAVDFQPNYDGKTEEPTVLPAAIPNLLCNGASGIAVGMATNIPPHNLAEICAALLHLIKHPNASIATLLGHMPGPDFPTGGELVESSSAILEAYQTGRGGLRIRARWETEKLKGGAWQAVVTEIPYQVYKGKLIERIADLLLNRKLPMLIDIRDESAEDIRLVLEPKSRNVDPDLLMESLFRHTDLEIRFGLNMNVLDAEQTPRVMNLSEVLQAFLDHRHEVLQRRTANRLTQVERRLEILDGYLIAFLNLDEVIRIVRHEDEPKDALIKAFDLTALQADEILNMRLRALRKLEEIEIRKNHAELKEERGALKSLLGDEAGRWKVVAGEITDIRNRFGKDKVLGPRRTTIGEPSKMVVVPVEAMIEREPVTILCSEHGWIRAQRGHLAEDADLKYKEGDSHRFHLHAETTDKLLVFGTNGRFYTLGADKLPGGRGFGEPLNLMIDLGSGHDIVTVMVHKPDRVLLVAAGDGRGFLVKEADVIAQTRAGKQILNTSGDVEARLCIPAEGDHVAVIGDNRKLLIFNIEETPTMARGRGVILQRYKDGGLSDARVFRIVDGLAWKHGGGVRTETALDGWLGKRAQAGRLPPAGFPRNNKFG